MMNKSETKKLNISMSYIYVGDVSINVPLELLKGKSEQEQLVIAYNYACDHIDEIPVSNNAEYIPCSDSFEMEDIEWDEQNQ